MFRIPLPSQERSAAVVVTDDHHTHHFPTREQALAYALQECHTAAHRGIHDAIIKIQGSDGQWRAFDSRLMPVHGLTEPASLQADLTDALSPNDVIAERVTAAAKDSIA